MFALLKRSLVAALCAALLVATTALADLASVKYPTTKASITYSAYWHKAFKQCGRCAGRNIRRYGIRQNGRIEQATYNQIVRSTHQLIRITSPAPRYMVRTAIPPAQAPAGVYTTSTRAALPYCTWGPESGGNYQAVNYSNPNRPAGKYQIITSTWLAYGGGQYAPTADQASPSAQDAVAARLYAAEGGHPWTNC